jgi:hypothetical protein
MPAAPNEGCTRRAPRGACTSPKNRHPAIIREAEALACVRFRTASAGLPRAHYFALKGLLGAGKHSKQLLQEDDQ